MIHKVSLVLIQVGYDTCHVMEAKINSQIGVQVLGVLVVLVVPWGQADHLHDLPVCTKVTKISIYLLYFVNIMLILLSIKPSLL